MSLVSFSALLGFRSPTAFRHQHLKICSVSFSNYTHFPNSGLVAQWLEYHTHCSYVRLVICRYDVSVGGQSSGLCTDTRMPIEFVPFSEDLLTHTQNHTMKIAMEWNYCFNLRGSRPWEGWGSNAYNTAGQFPNLSSLLVLTAVLIANYWVSKPTDSWGEGVGMCHVLHIPRPALIN